MPETGLSCAGVIVFCCLVSACLAQHRAEVVDVQATTTRLDAARVTPRSASDTRTTTSTPLLYPSRLPDPPCDPRSSSSDCAIGPSKENARWLAPAQASADFGPLFSPPFASRQASLTSRSVLQTDFRGRSSSHATCVYEMCGRWCLSSVSGSRGGHPKRATAYVAGGSGGAGQRRRRCAEGDGLHPAGRQRAVPARSSRSAHPQNPNPARRHTGHLHGRRSYRPNAFSMSPERRGISPTVRSTDVSLDVTAAM